MVGNTNYQKDKWGLSMFQNKSFIILSVRQDLKRSFTIVVVPLLTPSRIKFCQNKTERIKEGLSGWKMEVASLVRVRIFLIVDHHF